MLRDLRNIKNYQIKEELNANHRDRFIQKLNHLDKGRKPRQWNLFKIAAAVVLIFSMGYFAKFTESVVPSNVEVSRAGLSSLSPRLGQIENYYLNSINYELANLDVDSSQKELFDGYLFKIEELTEGYLLLSRELEENGFNEATCNAMIENLQLRLNLIKDLKEQLKDSTNEK
ncbi:MAG: hypothetical protein ACPGR7_04910 [Flavobacteriaceae bacterium]